MSGPRHLPDGRLLAFYGDDLTGSSAAMEVLAFAGLETVLFLSPPSPERLAAFPTARAIGLAGIARSQGPAWMDRHLPAIFGLLRGLESPVIHYKVCSTFDSAPHVGSIGRAIDLAVPILEPAWIPLVVADPGMGRFQAFGNLFAMVDGVAHRLDRHTTMARHPVTPMDEADLARHLAKQTTRRIGLVDLVAMNRGQSDARLDQERTAGAEIVSLDVLDQETLIEAGRLVWDRGGERIFAVGSQGLEASLVAYWRSIGALGEAPAPARPGPVARVACVSGSVSPVTAAQIAFALEHGFAGIRLDATRAVDAAAWSAEVGRVADLALGSLAQGADPLVFTATGPDDPAVAELRTAVATSRVAAEMVNDRIGEGLGQILRRVLGVSGLTRTVIAGGDTSSHAAAALGIDALTARAPLAPGSPLCRAHGSEPGLDGLEIALKGGQVGRPDFFAAVRQGSALG